MTTITIDTFEGLAPIVEEMKLPNSSATKAKNVRVDSGSLRGMRTTTPVTGVTVPSGAAAVHIRQDKTRVFSSDPSYSAVNSFIIDDQNLRYFSTSESQYPKRHSLINGNWVEFRLGLPMPSPVGVSSPINDPTDLDIAPELSYVSWVISFVSSLGEEGPLSPPSASVWRKEGDVSQISIPAFPNVVGFDFNTGAAIRLYRLNLNSQNQAEYQLVKEFDFSVNGTTVDDDVSNSDLTEVAINVDWFMPPCAENQVGSNSGLHDDEKVFTEGALQGIKLLPNNSYAGFAGKSVHISYPGVPSAWPWEYIRSSVDTILSIEVTVEGLLVITEGLPFLISGQDPSSMIITQLSTGYRCSSKESIVDMGEYIMYSSVDGLVLGVGTDLQLVTRDLFSREDWAKYNPNTLKASRWGDKYVGFYSNTEGFIFDPISKRTAFIEINGFDASFAAYNLSTDKLELYKPLSEVVEFGEGATATAVEWKSKTYFSKLPMAFTAVHVTADPSVIAAGITVTITAGDQVDSFVMPSSFDGVTVERLNLDDFETEWAIEFSFFDPIGGALHSVALAESMEELV